jgi:hypothetical protein
MYSLQDAARLKWEEELESQRLLVEAVGAVEPAGPPPKARRKVRTYQFIAPSVPPGEYKRKRLAQRERAKALKQVRTLRRLSQAHTTKDRQPLRTAGRRSLCTPQHTPLWPVRGVIQRRQGVCCGAAMYVLPRGTLCVRRSDMVSTCIRTPAAGGGDAGVVVREGASLFCFGVCVRACVCVGGGGGGGGGVLASDASAPPTGLLLAAAPSADEQPGSACGSCAPLRLSAALADAHPPSECDGVSAGAAAGDLSSAEATGSRSAGDEGWVAVGTRVVGGG